MSDAPYKGAIYGILKVYTNTMTDWNKTSNWIWQEFISTGNVKYVRYAVNSSSWFAWAKIGGAAYKDVKTLTNAGSVGWTSQEDGDKYVVSKAFMAFWNGRYSDAGGCNLKYCVDGTIQAKPTTLYNNTTGTNGTVTLSETSANFTYLEIFCRKNNSAYYVTQKVYSPNGKKVSIIGSWSATEGGYALLQFNTKIIQISGTSITSPGAGSGNLGDDDKNWVDNTANDLYIVRVVGYK